MSAAEQDGVSARLRHHTSIGLAWAAAGVLSVGVTSWAMYQEVVTYRHPTVILAGQDFWNNSWRAVRGLLSGIDIYGPTQAVIPGIEPAFPVSEHLPASLIWQAPFAGLPIPIALFAFTLASILAIWASVFVLTRPTEPWAVLASTACGAFAIMIAGGPETLLLGQPTAFTLLGLATLVRARQPWLAGLGFMLAATTLQTGAPLALALLLLNSWPLLWRGLVISVACSALPVGLEIANGGLGNIVSSSISQTAAHVERRSNQIDLGALLRAVGVTNVGLQLLAGLVLAAICLMYIARLARPARRISNPPVFCLVITVVLLCTYHQYYDVLLVGAGVVPLVLVVDRSWPMLPSMALAAIGSTLAIYDFRDVAVPLCLLGVAVLSGIAARRVLASDPGPIGSELKSATLAVPGESVS